MADVTDDVVLRDVTADDLEIFFEHQRDPVAYAMADFPPRDREAFMAHWSKILADDAVQTRTVVHGGQVVGNVVSWGQSGQREIGYWMDRQYWGRGIATQALAGFISLITPRPLYAHVATHNVGSQRVLSKCGFRISRVEDAELVLVLNS